MEPDASTIILNVKPRIESSFTLQIFFYSFSCRSAHVRNPLGAGFIGAERNPLFSKLQALFPRVENDNIMPR
jgi:hypothetical protein